MNTAGPIYQPSCMLSSLSVPASLLAPLISRCVPITYTSCYSNLLGRQDENDLAEQLVGFFQQFLEVFKEMSGKKFYLTGESVRKQRTIKFEPYY